MQPIATHTCRFVGVRDVRDEHAEDEVCVRERHFHWWARDREVAREPESGCRALLPCPMAHARRHARAVSRARATAARTPKSFRALNSIISPSSAHVSTHCTAVGALHGYRPVDAPGWRWHRRFRAPREVRRLKFCLTMMENNFRPRSKHAAWFGVCWPPRRLLLRSWRFRRINRRTRSMRRARATLARAAEQKVSADCACGVMSYRTLQTSFVSEIPAGVLACLRPEARRKKRPFSCHVIVCPHSVHR